MKNISWLFFRQYFKEVSFVGSDADKDTIKKRNSKLLSVDLKIIENLLAKQKFKMKIQYPGLVTGVGINHEANIEGEFKLGVHFDYTYGMPVIYGSSVKGLLRSAFPENEVKEQPNEKPGKKRKREKSNKLRELKTSYIRKCLGTGYENINVDDFRDYIFEGVKFVLNEKGEKEKRNISIYERDVFFDAVIVKPYEKKDKNGNIIPRILDSDAITPHGDDLLKNPKPITFLKIASGVTMEFRFDLKSCNIDGIAISEETKTRLFRQILLDFGIGAKTNVGYGQFSEVVVR